MSCIAAFAFCAATLLTVDHSPARALEAGRFRPAYCALRANLARFTNVGTDEQTCFANSTPRALLAPPSRSFLAAAMPWYALLFVALIALVECTRRLTALPRLSVVAGVAGCGAAGVAAGTIESLLGAGVASASLLLASGRPRAAALTAIGLCAAPPLGIPIVLALFLWAPATRGVLAATGGAALLAAAGLAFAPVPLHLPAAAGLVAAAPAAVLGFLVATTAAVALAGPVGRRLDPAAIVALPAAAAALAFPAAAPAALPSALPSALPALLLALLLAGAPNAVAGSIGWAAAALLAATRHAAVTRGVLALEGTATGALVAGALRESAGPFRLLAGICAALAAIVAEAVPAHTGDPAHRALAQSAIGWFAGALAGAGCLALFLPHAQPRERYVPRHAAGSAPSPGFHGLKSE